MISCRYLGQFYLTYEINTCTVDKSTVLPLEHILSSDMISRIRKKEITSKLTSLRRYPILNGKKCDRLCDFGKWTIFMTLSCTLTHKILEILRFWNHKAWYLACARPTGAWKTSSVVKLRHDVILMWKFQNAFLLSIYLCRESYKSNRCSKTKIWGLCWPVTIQAGTKGRRGASCHVISSLIWR